MKVLIACEESQTVCKAFRARDCKSHGRTAGITQARGNPGGKEIT
jgi:hypothetical protein